MEQDIVKTTILLADINDMSKVQEIYDAHFRACNQVKGSQSSLNQNDFYCGIDSLPACTVYQVI